MPNFIYSLPVELVRAIEAALRLGLTDKELVAAASLLGGTDSEDTAPDAARIVTTVEKATGLALDPPDFKVATAAVRRLLEQFAAEESLALDVAPDAHLEMAFEDCISGADQG